tara:strand:+ start:1782 stop:2225 length:444 start_codon:yes stop_codon:yes gene_type:complete
MISLKTRLMTHPMSTLTKLVNDVRKDTELPDYLKLSVGKKRFTKEVLADHLVKLHKTKFFNGNAIKALKAEKKGKLPMTKKEIKDLPPPAPELGEVPKKKIKFKVMNPGKPIDMTPKKKRPLTAWNKFVKAQGGVKNAKANIAEYKK